MALEASWNYLARMSLAAGDTGATRIRLEVCVDGLASAQAAEAGGADRIELCSALELGGLTPSLAMVEACRAALTIPLQVMLRPRAGDFCYSTAELDCIRRDLEHCREAGADAVVLGILNSAGDLAIPALRELVSELGTMKLTFHRAFDMIADQQAALLSLAELGISHILSSGGQASAVQGRERLASLLRSSAELGPSAPVLVAAAGIDRDNLGALIKATGVREVHVGSACRTQVDSQMKHRNLQVHMGLDACSDEYARLQTDAKLVRELVEILS